METKLTNSNFSFLNSISDTYRVNSINCSTSGGGRAGGIALIWNHCNITVDIMDSDFNYFDVLISTATDPIKWRATGIYGYPQHHNKYLTCRLINDLSEYNTHSQWLIFGDFNLLLHNGEKMGGNMIDPNITTSFRNTLSHCDLQDLGFNGSKYTWTNKHPGEQLILARLDRFLANFEWINTFPHFKNNHLLRFKSDHSPILLTFSSSSPHRSGMQNQKVYRFEHVWTRNEQHLNKVREAWLTNQGNLATKLKSTLEHLHNWGHTLFGTLPRKIKQAQEELMTLNQIHGTTDLSQQIKEKEQELDMLLDGEEMWWKQRSRADWLQHGDKNTRFFHMKAIQRRKRNKISEIKDNQGTVWTDSADIERVLMDHFRTLFTKQDTQQIAQTVEVVKDRLNHDMKEHLSTNFTEEEVYKAIKDMKSMAAPGPDGLPALFYHTYWDIIGKDVILAALDVLNNNGDPSQFNHTHICLIPKIPNPISASDYRPISLCNVTLKIVTKTVANRLKSILPELISPNQSAFVQGRLITDNTIIAHEIFHFFTHSLLAHIFTK
jgi:hypothetical protein